MLHADKFSYPIPCAQWSQKKNCETQDESKGCPSEDTDTACVGPVYRIIGAGALN